MAMNFNLAGRAQAPDLLQAEIADGNFRQQKHNAEELRDQTNMEGAMTLGKGAYDAGLFDKLMASKVAPVAGSIPAGAGSLAGSTVAAPMMSASAPAIGGAGASAPMMSAAPMAGAGGALAGGAGGAGTGAVVGGATPTAAAGPLAAMGPYGWAAMAALAAGAYMMNS